MSALDSFAAVARAIAVLEQHPDGLPIVAVADELGLTTKKLRKLIFEYYTAEGLPEYVLGLVRADPIEFLGPEGEEEDPHEAVILRVQGSGPLRELGLEYLRGDQIATLYHAASRLAVLEPENEPLAEAIAILVGTFLSGADLADDVAYGPPGVLSALRDGLDRRTVVRIEYSRQWNPGVSTRNVHPYALVHTRRGWELDAGPIGDTGPRTFLVDRIASANLTDERFERPEGVDKVLTERRSEVEVEMLLPQRTRWVADRFAESVRAITEDAQDVTVGARFLPPVEDRVGLILAIAGPDAFVIGPEEYRSAGSTLAGRLLAHHGLD